MDLLFPYSEDKIKPYLKMSVQRLQLLKSKKSNQSKHQKREVAQFLAKGKEELARIKVEHIIREDFTIEAFEILELLCELVHERIRFISNSKECPAELVEGIATLIWATAHVEVAELGQVRNQLEKKFGRNFLEKNEQCVNPRILKKLSVDPPSSLLVFRYLEEIAKEYNIDYTPTDAPSYSNHTAASIESAPPLPTPVGFSVPIAPGSNLPQAYHRPGEFNNHSNNTSINNTQPSPSSLNPPIFLPNAPTHMGPSALPGPTSSHPAPPPIAPVYTPPVPPAQFQPPIYPQNGYEMNSSFSATTNTSAAMPFVGPSEMIENSVNNNNNNYNNNENGNHTNTNQSNMVHDASAVAGSNDSAIAIAVPVAPQESPSGRILKTPQNGNSNSAEITFDMLQARLNALNN